MDSAEKEAYLYNLHTKQAIQRENTLIRLSLLIIIVLQFASSMSDCQQSKSSLASTKAHLAGIRGLAAQMSLINTRLDLLNSKMEQRCRP